MDRRTLVASVVASALGLGAGAVAGAGGSPQPIRHENPATAAVENQPGAVFEYFLAAFSQLNARRYQYGRQLIRQLNRASLPPEVTSTLDDLNELLVKQGSLVETSERWVRDIAALQQAGRTADARRLLARLNDQLRRAEVLFTDASGDIQDLRGRVEGALAADPAQKRAFDELQRAAGRVRVLLAVYRATSKTPTSVAAVGSLLPHETTVELSLPRTAYPGRPFIVAGTADERAASPSTRLLTLYLDGQVVTQLPVTTFRVQFTLPPNVATGEHEFRIVVPAEGRYLGAETRRTVEVSRVTITLRADIPGWILVPGRLNFSGVVTSELGPLANAWVRVRLGTFQAESVTSEDGAFRISAKLPAALSLAGPAALTVTVSPGEPWFDPVIARRGLMVVNPISMGIPGAALVLGLVLLYRRRRRPLPVKAPPEMPTAAEPVTAPIALAPTRASGPVATELLAIYLQVLRRLETVFGFRPGPSTTLREFAGRLQSRLRGDALWEMTELAEMALYSPDPITPALVERTQALGRLLEAELPGA